MQNVKMYQPAPAVSGLQVAAGSRNDLPPTKSFGELVLESLFGDEKSNDDVLAPFDYEGFLRREGYHA